MSEEKKGGKKNGGEKNLIVETEAGFSLKNSDRSLADLYRNGSRRCSDERIEIRLYL